MNLRRRKSSRTDIYHEVQPCGIVVSRCNSYITSLTLPSWNIFIEHHIYTHAHVSRFFFVSPCGHTVWLSTGSIIATPISNRGQLLDDDRRPTIYRKLHSRKLQFFNRSGQFAVFDDRKQFSILQLQTISQQHFISTHQIQKRKTKPKDLNIFALF